MRGCSVGLTSIPQIPGDSGKGAVLGDFEGEAAGIGPAINQTVSMGDVSVVLSLRSLDEFDVENRRKGDHIYLGATCVF
jgi:hypothetical protein